MTREAFAEAIAAISRRGAERQAETSAIAVRGMFKWLGGDAQRARYGVAQDLLRGLRAPERSMDESDAGGALHVPDGEEIGRIVGWLTTSNAPERNRLAGRLLVYAAQRRRAVAMARAADFREVDGVVCWVIPALHRKSASV